VLHRQKLRDLSAEYADAVDPRVLTCHSLEFLEPSIKIARTSASNSQDAETYIDQPFIHHGIIQPFNCPFTEADVCCEMPEINYMEKMIRDISTLTLNYGTAHQGSLRQRTVRDAREYMQQECQEH